jgi:hypothetical protein
LNPQSEKVGVPEDPLEVTLDFYNNWLNDLKSTSTNPYDSGLINNLILTPEVRAQIQKQKAEWKEGAVDPVLCLPNVPERIGGKINYAKDDRAVILVLPRGEAVKTDYKAIVSLTMVDSKWFITRLDCSQGEFAPEKEFDFEQTGNILKESIGAPYDSSKWHLVYTQELKDGYVVPLSFTPESICIGYDGSESVCDPTQLKETTKVFVQASMEETGAVVKKMTLK